MNINCLFFKNDSYHYTSRVDKYPISYPYCPAKNKFSTQNFEKYLKEQYLYTPSFKGTNILTKYPIYNINNYIPNHQYDDAILTARINQIGNIHTNVYPYQNKDDVSNLIDGLRTGEVREFQFQALNRLVQNPKFSNAKDLTKLVSQMNTVERGQLFLEQIDKYSKKYPDISAKELVAIIPRLEPDKLDIQEKFIDKIYMQKTSKDKVPLENFTELLSSIENKDTAEIQLSFFEDLMYRKNMTPTIAMSLISNIEDKERGVLKKYTALKLMNKGIEAEDLPIIIPKIRNTSIAKLNSKMADYFIEQRHMDSEIATRIMSNISEPRVFYMHKNLIEDMSKLRNFEPIDTLKILGDIQTPEMAELKSAVIHELAKIDKLNGHDIMHIVTNVDNIYGAEVKVKTAKKLAEIDSLNGDNIGYIVAGCHNEENSKVKCKTCEELTKIKGMTGNAITTIASRVLKDETANIQIDSVKELASQGDFNPSQIARIVKGIRNIDFKNAKFAAKDELLKNKKIPTGSLVKILDKINGESKDKYLLACIDKMSKNDTFTTDDITKIATTMTINKHTCNKYIDYFATIPQDIRKDITDYSVVQDFHKFKDKQYLNRFDRRDLVTALIKHNASLFDGQDNAAVRKLFPFLPANSTEFCELLPTLAKSLDFTPANITIKSQNTINRYSDNILELCNPNSDFLKINFEDSRNTPTLKYKREEFIKDVDNILKDFPPLEREKITDQFGFILGNHDNKTTMNGFPKVPNRYTNIYTNTKTFVATMKIAKCIDNYTNDNHLVINTTIPTVKCFDSLFEAIPELFTLVEKKQNEWHCFDTFTHTMRVLQEVIKNERFQKLNNNDKVILATAALLHDISKEELVVDKSHSLTGAYDAFQISKRLNLSDADRSKLFAIIRNHEWLKYYNKEGVSDLQKIERAKTVAFTLREGNAFDMVSILSEADLKGMQKKDASYELFKEAQKEGNSEVARYVRDLQRTAIPLPQNKLPKASELIADGNIIREANIGGIKNKVIYLYKNMGKGSLPFDKNLDPNDFNILVHALDSEKNSLIFQRMDEVDSDTLISASYVNLAKGNWKTFRQQGYILDVDSDNIHAAYFKDFGSGLSKNIDRLKLDYLFEGYFKPQRDYISQKIKEKLHINDESYKTLYQDIKNKSLPEIRKEYPFVSAAIKQIYMEMQGGEYTYGRNYNEVLVTRPKIQGVFAYDRSITQVPKYLRQYAADADIPVIIFMD